MIINILLLIAGLGLILLATEGFTNGVEAAGRRFSFSQAVVGSILAAVGTALPETILPVVAIIFGGKGAGKAIGTGAILGAPFMLSTLAFFLVGLTALITFICKRREFEINIEAGSAARDLTFFIAMYSAAVFIPMIAGKAAQLPLAVLLIAGYAVYVQRTVNGESAEIEHPEGLHLNTFFAKIRFIKSASPGTFLIAAQVAAALVIMVYGAQVFVKGLEAVSTRFGLNPLLFALVLAPIATELPEKFNSVSWTLKGKDGLAFGNITGAMVFQSTFPVSIGLLFTDWHIAGMALFSAVIALACALIILIELKIRERVSPVTLIFCGSFYVVYICVLLFAH